MQKLVAFHETPPRISKVHLDTLVCVHTLDATPAIESDEILRPSGRESGRSEVSRLPAASTLHTFDRTATPRSVYDLRATECV